MQSIYIRLALYVLSSLLGLLPAAAAGWGVRYNPELQVLTVELLPLLTAILSGFGLSAGILARWGVR